MASFLRLFGWGKSKKNEHQDEMEPFHLLHLPPEIVQHVISFLEVPELVAISQTSKHLLEIANSCWKYAVSRDFQIELVAKENDVNWRRYYFLRGSILHSEKENTCFQWIEMIAENKPSPRMAHSAVHITLPDGKDRIVIIGGQFSDKVRYNDIYMFDPDHFSFSKLTLDSSSPSLAPKFARHTSVAVGHKIYSFGGYDGFSNYFELSVLDVGTVPPVVVLTFAVNRTWTYPETSGTKPLPRTNHASAVIGKKIYIYGGNNSSSHEQYHVLGELHVLDTETMTWTTPVTKGKSPGARTAHVLIAVGKKLFLFFGGIWEPKPVNRWVKKFNDTYIYDTETNEWSCPAIQGNIPICSFPLTFVIEQWIFFFGGQKIDEEFITNRLFCFDTVTFSCHEIKQIKGKAATARDLGSAIAIGHWVYMFGGSSGAPVDEFDVLLWASRKKWYDSFEYRTPSDGQM